MSKGKAEKRTKTYVDELFRKLKEPEGVKDVIILNKDANPIRSTMKQAEALDYCGYYERLYQKVVYIVHQLDPEDELLRMRVRTKYDETLVAQDDKIMAIVVQNAKDMVQPRIKRIPDKTL